MKCRAVLLWCIVLGPTGILFGYVTASPEGVTAALFVYIALSDFTVTSAGGLAICDSLSMALYLHPVRAARHSVDRKRHSCGQLLRCSPCVLQEPMLTTI
eukprot:1322691-Amphidinium_carterae.1